MSTVYDYSMRSLSGVEVDLSTYKGKALLIVNTASQCGLTPQYSGLQELYEKYADQDFEILGFPCNQFGEQEPGTHEEVEAFCRVNYGVTFPMFEKTLVNGPNAHPLFQFLKEQAPYEGESVGEGNDIRWNFTKFLVNRRGEVVKRCEPSVVPEDIESSIQALE